MQSYRPRIRTLPVVWLQYSPTLATQESPGFLRPECPSLFLKELVAWAEKGMRQLSAVCGDYYLKPSFQYPRTYLRQLDPNGGIRNITCHHVRKFGGSGWLLFAPGGTPSRKTQYSASRSKNQSNKFIRSTTASSLILKRKLPCDIFHAPRAHSTVKLWSAAKEFHIAILCRGSSTRH